MNAGMNDVIWSCDLLLSLKWGKQPGTVLLFFPQKWNLAAQNPPPPKPATVAAAIFRAVVSLVGGGEDNLPSSSPAELQTPGKRKIVIMQAEPPGPRGETRCALGRSHNYQRFTLFLCLILKPEPHIRWANPVPLSYSTSAKWQP